MRASALSKLGALGVLKGETVPFWGGAVALSLLVSLSGSGGAKSGLGTGSGAHAWQVDLGISVSACLPLALPHYYDYWEGDRVS